MWTFLGHFAFMMARKKKSGLDVAAHVTPDQCENQCEIPIHEYAGMPSLGARMLKQVVGPGVVSI